MSFVSFYEYFTLLYEQTYINVIGWKKGSLRHNLGSGRWFYGANWSHSNAYQKDTSRPFVQNICHALGRRIKVQIFNISFAT